jgi:hypothetical protein
MSQTLTLHIGPLSDRRQHRPSIWGLTAPQLHEAYWRSRGVQCVRRGEADKLSRSAELFLLLEPGQMVLFDLPKLIERLVWRKAAVTRLRVTDQEDKRYGERVITDEHGLVERIERRYRPATRATYRIQLTAQRRIAALWMAAASRRVGWDTTRRAVAWSRVDHVRCPGGCFAEGNARAEHGLISRLVASWADPAQVFEGIEKAAPKVWKAEGDTIAAGTVLVGPLWLGHGGIAEDDACLVGPTWTTDQPTARADGARVRIRKINEIELHEDRGSREATADHDPGTRTAAPAKQRRTTILATPSPSVRSTSSSASSRFFWRSPSLSLPACASCSRTAGPSSTRTFDRLAAASCSSAGSSAR